MQCMGITSSNDVKYLVFNKKVLSILLDKMDKGNRAE